MNKVILFFFTIFSFYDLPAMRRVLVAADVNILRIYNQIADNKPLTLAEIELLLKNPPEKQQAVEKAKGKAVEHDIKRQLRVDIKKELSFYAQEILKSQDESLSQSKDYEIYSQLMAIAKTAYNNLNELGLAHNDERKLLNSDPAVIEIFLYNLLQDQPFKQYLCEEQLLFGAVCYDNIRILKFFLDRGISPDSTLTSSLVDNHTLLTAAVLHSAEKAVNYLLQNNANCYKPSGRDKLIPLNAITEKRFRGNDQKLTKIKYLVNQATNTTNTK
ncbi:MAG TPA: hypothetical protein VHA52_01415 [Candidatus Babeliaceae bacterium]|nr:hypothetical protein [Candidatus Babeliaceae bacterium]